MTRLSKIFYLADFSKINASTWTELLQSFFTVLKTSNRRVFLLVEMGSFVHSTSPALWDFMWLINSTVEIHSNVYVILSYSSGHGWMSLCNTDNEIFIDKMWNNICCILYPISSRNFSELEAKLYMSKNNIDDHWNKQLQALTGWNPLLLSYFKDVEEKSFRSRVDVVEKTVDKVIVELLKVKGDDLVEAKLLDCVKWLTYAQNSFQIGKKEGSEFFSSCVANEHLVYIIESPEKFTLTLLYI